MAKKQNTSDAADTPSPQSTAPALSVYEVLCKSIKVGGVIAYRSARVNLTKEQADALNSAQPGSVRFLGI